jgi:hypothetical protein
MANDEQSEPASSLSERAKRGLESKDIPHLYSNGFVTATGTGDIMVILERNGQSVATINLSYTVAKTLGLNLLNTVSSFETAVGRPILTSEEIVLAMQTKNKSSESAA